MRWKLGQLRLMARASTHKWESQIERVMILAPEKSWIMARFDLSDAEWAIV